MLKQHLNPIFTSEQSRESKKPVTKNLRQTAQKRDTKCANQTPHKNATRRKTQSVTNKNEKAKTLKKAKKEAKKETRCVPDTRDRGSYELALTAQLNFFIHCDQS